MVTQGEIGTLADRVMGILSKRPLSRARVVHLGGDLGAGKTTFTKELAGLMGIEKEEVNSPTFILKKEYKGSHPVFRKLIHIDAYRFSTPEEGKVLKLENDFQNENTIIAIEWPGKMKPMYADVDVFFSVIDDDTREVTVTYEEK